MKIEIDIISITDILKKKGRSFTERLLKKFSCPKNLDVESFLKGEAINFTKKGIATTYLVVGTEKSSTDEPSTDERSSEKAHKFTLGYFALANMPLIGPSETPDAKNDKTILLFSHAIDDNITNVMASLLIAQFAKNDALPDDIKAEFTGSMLMDYALRQVKHIHEEAGGRTVYLECENVDVLTAFYEKQGFFLFGERTTSKKVQMLRYMKVFPLTHSN